MPAFLETMTSTVFVSIGVAGGEASNVEAE